MGLSSVLCLFSKFLLSSFYRNTEPRTYRSLRTSLQFHRYRCRQECLWQRVCLAQHQRLSGCRKVEQILEEKVRPVLRAHGGDVALDRVEGKTVYVKLLGQCAGCPSADLTNETVVEAELVEALPGLIERVVAVQNVSDELWEQAKKLLRDHRL